MSWIRRRLRALVLLGGSVRPSQMGKSINRSILDLPIDPEATILDHWIDQAGRLAQDLGLDQIPMRVMINNRSKHPSVRNKHSRIVVADRRLVRWH